MVNVMYVYIYGLVKYYNYFKINNIYYYFEVWLIICYIIFTLF